VSAIVALLRTARRMAGRTTAAMGRFWRSVRPTTRRGAVLGLLAIIGGGGVLAVGLFVGATLAWSPYVESVVHPDTNPRLWAALEPAYAESSTCATCHATEATKGTSGLHAGIGCASCHGPLMDHALASTGTAAAAANVTVPTDEVCVRCHASALGRPAAIRQVVPAEHYVELCLQCHDPHTGISRRPPVVEHPLANLPPCVTCHGPDGFKARNQRHPVVADDERCLDCHAPGRGPEDGR
jgi:Cytochrome c554 and c-prime